MRSILLLLLAAALCVTAGPSFITLPNSLPFGKTSALEPHISNETVTYHYYKHQAGYVRQLNEILDSSDEDDYSDMRIIDLLVDRSLRNGNSKMYKLAAQIFNHAFYFSLLTDANKAKETRHRMFHHPENEKSEFVRLLLKQYGTLRDLERAIKLKAEAHFGSGWVWLLYQKRHKNFVIVDTHDAAIPNEISSANPSKLDYLPLLICDVWEHAYYLDYMNDRRKYVEAWFHVLDWEAVEMRFNHKLLEGEDGSTTGYPSFRYASCRENDYGKEKSGYDRREFKRQEEASDEDVWGQQGSSFDDNTVFELMKKDNRKRQARRQERQQQQQSGGEYDTWLNDLKYHYVGDGETNRFHKERIPKRRKEKSPHYSFVGDAKAPSRFHKERLVLDDNKRRVTHEEGSNIWISKEKPSQQEQKKREEKKREQQQPPRRRPYQVPADLHRSDSTYSPAAGNVQQQQRKRQQQDIAQHYDKNLDEYCDDDTWY